MPAVTLFALCVISLALFTLTITTFCDNSAYDKMMAFSTENRILHFILHFMQTVFSEDSLHEMSTSVLGVKKKKNISNCSC